MQRSWRRRGDHDERQRAENGAREHAGDVMYWQYGGGRSVTMSSSTGRASSNGDVWEGAEVMAILGERGEGREWSGSTGTEGVLARPVAGSCTLWHDLAMVTTSRSV
jgi:hypothetical protein